MKLEEALQNIINQRYYDSTNEEERLALEFALRNLANVGLVNKESDNIWEVTELAKDKCLICPCKKCNTESHDCVCSLDSPEGCLNNKYRQCGGKYEEENRKVNEEIDAINLTISILSKKIIGLLITKIKITEGIDEVNVSELLKLGIDLDNDYALPNDIPFTGKDESILMKLMRKYIYNSVLLSRYYDNTYCIGASDAFINEYFIKIYGVDKYGCLFVESLSSIDFCESLDKYSVIHNVFNKMSAPTNLTESIIKDLDKEEYQSILSMPRYDFTRMFIDHQKSVSDQMTMYYCNRKKERENNIKLSDSDLPSDVGLAVAQLAKDRKDPMFDKMMAYNCDRKKERDVIIAKYADAVKKDSLSMLEQNCVYGVTHNLFITPQDILTNHVIEQREKMGNISEFTLADYGYLGLPQDIMEIDGDINRTLELDATREKFIGAIISDFRLNESGEILVQVTKPYIDNNSGDARKALIMHQSYLESDNAKLTQKYLSEKQLLRTDIPEDHNNDTDVIFGSGIPFPEIWKDKK